MPIQEATDKLNFNIERSHEHRPLLELIFPPASDSGKGRLVLRGPVIASLDTDSSALVSTVLEVLRLTRLEKTDSYTQVIPKH